MTSKQTFLRGLRMAGIVLSWSASAPMQAQSPAPAAATSAATVEAPKAAAAPVVAPFDWREAHAYALGIQAFHYLYPWAYMPGARWTRTENAGRQANRFAHIRDLETAAKLSGGGPNNDTLYSRAWLYVKDEPVIVSVPAIAERYYTLEFVDWLGDNFDYVGTRATGTQAGHYAVIPVGWKGTLPTGVKALTAVTTPWAIIMGRTFVKDAADLPAVRAIQDQYKITPLSQWGIANAVAPKTPEIWQPLETKADPLADWKNINRALTEVSPDPRDADLVQSFKQLGIGPGLDVDAQPAAIKRGLARAAVDGQRIVAQAINTGHLQNKVNGWFYPPKTIGRPTQSRDWLFRAMQALAGWVANDPEEAVYLNVAQDAQGQPLIGNNKYVIRFKPEGLPKVKAFWSITMYNPLFNLFANPLNRYAVGDRSGLKPDADGGLTIYVQRDSPGIDNESNWLPTPQNGRFLMFLRAYFPGDEILNQTWQPPDIVRVTNP
jgi:hypothetical protein